jgi:hypothetical protein
MIKSQTITSRDDLENGKWKGILSAVRFVMRVTLHTTMHATPMQLVYGRNAIHNICFEANWQYIKARWQRVIHCNNECENVQRTPHMYLPGHRFMLSQHQERKYGIPKYKGPYTVDSVNDNGTLHLSVLKGNGTVYETRGTYGISIQAGIDPPVGFCAVPAPQYIHLSRRNSYYVLHVQQKCIAPLSRGQIQYTVLSHSRLKVPDGTEP